MEPVLDITLDTESGIIIKIENVHTASGKPATLDALIPKVVAGAIAVEPINVESFKIWSAATADTEDSGPGLVEIDGDVAPGTAEKFIIKTIRVHTVGAMAADYDVAAGDIIPKP